MTTGLQPRTVTSVLVEERDGVVTVTWGLGNSSGAAVDFFGYGVDYYGPDGDGGKRFGVRVGGAVTAHVFEWSSSTQANYDGEAVSISADRIVASYRHASIGLVEVGSIHAFAHIDGVDSQLDLPVTLLR